MIGICVGYGLGKSAIVTKIVERLGPNKIAVIHFDENYRQRHKYSFEECRNLNFDHF